MVGQAVAAMGVVVFFFQAEDGIRDVAVTGVQTCALPISWSIDDKRYHFQFSTEIAWEIKGGKKTRMLKHPSYSGITTEFWNSCDAICSREHWTLWGTPNCGKGQPMQTMGTGHGASPARFRNVKMGIAFSGQ